jgi:hypothetical protein
MGIHELPPHETPKRSRESTREDEERVRDDREENAANYKKNVDQLNRTRDTEIERALSGPPRSARGAG